MCLRHETSSRCSDLTPDHLPLLENIATKIPQVVHEKYGLKPAEVRMYFHYQPSFYHLHVHVVNVNHETHAQRVGQAVLLQVYSLRETKRMILLIGRY